MNYIDKRNGKQKVECCSCGSKEYVSTPDQPMCDFCFSELQTRLNQKN